MKSKYLPAMPTYEEFYDGRESKYKQELISSGLTKLEYFTAQAMAVLIDKWAEGNLCKLCRHGEVVGEQAVYFANATLDELEKSQRSEPPPSGTHLGDDAICEGKQV